MFGVRVLSEKNLPNGVKHSEHSLIMYGVDGYDIHSWMDEPSQIYGGGHRKFRHDPDIEIPQVFINKYGEELARNIILDHLYLDRELKNTEPVEVVKETKFPVDLLFNECPYEYLSKNYWDWVIWQNILECIETMTKKRIDYLNHLIKNGNEIYHSDYSINDHDIKKYRIGIRHHDYVLRTIHNAIDKWLKEKDIVVKYWWNKKARVDGEEK